MEYSLEVPDDWQLVTLSDNNLHIKDGNKYIYPRMEWVEVHNPYDEGLNSSSVDYDLANKIIEMEDDINSYIYF